MPELVCGLFFFISVLSYLNETLAPYVDEGSVRPI